jgi:hypothetical protein
MGVGHKKLTLGGSLSGILQVLLEPSGLKAVGLVLGSGGVFGAVRLYVRHHAQLELEREQSRRVRFRTLVLAKTALMVRPGTRVLARDPDGHLCLIDCFDVLENPPVRTLGSKDEI